MPTTFEASTKRGAPLAREILTTIEWEVEQKKNKRKRINHWDQGTWAEMVANEVPASTEVEVVDPVLLHRSRHWGGDDDALAFDSGLTCGTSMCFAGHAVHQVGDRMVVRAPSIVIRELGDKKTGKWRKIVRKVVENGNNRFGNNFYAEDTFDMVAAHALTADGDVEAIQVRARKLLGLTPHEADRFFDADNSLDLLRDYVKRMEDGRNIVTNRSTKKTRARAQGEVS